ncbi:SDR family oxidoreductase [Nitriliruptor alkaliphilus]|uniref:SDR family oxidoreductase n=1 Tax=Nitriliruptor alkaliphilus TaxID=427918 RepID=UPI00069874A0|nr:SDR family oxidoreductase [Nitriliruptor alkaliphilus]
MSAAGPVSSTRVAIVSGVGPGLGRSIALGLARDGARCVLAARREAELEKVAGEIRELGGDALVVPTDITDDAQVEHLIAATLDAYGRLDTLVNNAFVQPPLETLEAAELSTWEQAFAVNVFGTVRVTRAAIDALRADGGGNVVMINSMSARRTRERFGVYSAAKAALLSTARTLALELGPDGIRVNSVVPGYVWGPNLEAWFTHRAEKRGVSVDDVYAEVAADNALHHLPTADEVADSVVFLASDRAAAITGQTIDVNAGHWFH